MADERIQIDVSGALADIAKLKGGMADAQAQAAATGKAITAAFNTGAAQGVADAVNDLQKEYDDLKRSADTLKHALKGANDPTVVKLYARSIAELELGMQRLEKTGKAAGVSLKEANKQAGTGKQVFEGLFGTFGKVGLILAAIAAVKEFTQYAVTLAEQIGTAKRSFEAFTGSASEADKIVNDLIATGQKNFIPTDDILKAGKALLSFGESADNLPAVLSRLANVSAATGKDFNELAVIYGKARTAGVLFSEDINQLVDAGIPIIQEFSKQLGVPPGEIKKLASEGKISFEELQLAMFNLTAEGGKFADQSTIQSQTISGAWQRLSATVQPAIEKIGSFVGSIVTKGLNAVNSLAEGIGNLFSSTPEISAETLDREQLSADRREYEKELAERERIEKEAANKRKNSKKKTDKELAALEKERQQAILNGMKEGVEKEIAQENYRFKVLKKELKRFHLDTAEAEVQHNLNLQEIRDRETERLRSNLEKVLALRFKIYEAAVKNEDEANKKRAESLEKQVDNFTAERDLREQEIQLAEVSGEGMLDALRRQGASEEQIKAVQNELDAEFKRARLQNELDFQVAILGTIEAGDTKRLDSTLRTIDILRAKIANLDASTGGASAKKQSLLERLGFDDKSVEALKDAAREIIGAIQDITAANVAAKEEDLRAAEEKTQAAQEALDAEKQRHEDGFSSNVTLKQKELDQAKADEAKALTQKKAAQRQQLALDSALQLSALITSSAEIIKGFSTIPFVGPALGIAAVAAMFAAFAATKARAFAATKFKHGGSGRVDGNSIIVGESHDTGGVGIEAEGGEFFGTDGKRFGVVNKKMTAKHFDLLSAINKDDKAGMIAAVSRITKNKDAIGAAIGAGAGSAITIGGKDKETFGLLKDWKQKSTAPKTERTVEGGYVVERRGSYTRKIKIRA